MAVPILMYHSVSQDGPGPVSLPPAVFSDQLAVLADAGARGITMSEYVEARRLARPLPAGAVVLTFDDGYRDFAEAAAPALAARGWAATVFVPVRPVDANAPWDCGDGHPRALMDWPTIADVASNGIEIGAHSNSHADLTRLRRQEAIDEIIASGERIRAQTGGRVDGFAPPRGRLTPDLRREVARHYRWCAGTRLAVADDRSDVYELPRIEMWYFRDIARWRTFVARGWTPYFGLRRALRAVKSFAEERL